MYKTKHYYLCLFLVGAVLSKISVGQNETETKVVRITQGLVRGYKDEQHNVFEFTAIPYATVPTGADKFKAALPGPVWNDILEPNRTEIIICPQMLPEMLRVDNLVTKEDCLIANVYVPNTEETNLPVVVIVHGGGFQYGWGNFAPPPALVEQGNIIAITFNYRLGVQGFLCLGTEDIPGNAGMKDQLAALRWVKENIASFGGNPDDVTLTGYSAGGVSTELLMISETTRGLFNKVVPESGSVPSVWGFQIDPTVSAIEFARSYFNFETDDIQALNEFYKNKTVEELVVTNFEDAKDVYVPFCPCIERDTGSENIEIFLKDDPLDILRNGSYNRLPVLTGFTEMEGILRLPFFEQFKDEMNSNFGDFLPGDLIFESVEQKEEVALNVKQFYFDDKAVSNETMQNYIDYYTDSMFVYPILRSARLQVEAGNSDVYLYKYSYTDAILQSSNLYNYPGAPHVAQTFALTALGDLSNFSEDYRNVINLLRTLWSNFYKTGKPTTRQSWWPPTTAYGSPHLHFDTPTLVEGIIWDERVKFWDDIYEQFRQKPIAPRST